MSTNTDDADNSAQNAANIENAKIIQNSIEEVWFLKEINFKSQPVKIITQNYNGYACIARLFPYNRHLRI